MLKSSRLFFICRWQASTILLLAFLLPLISPKSIAIEQAKGAKVIPRIKSANPIGDKWAVVIGISKFADKQIPQLKFSSKDAKDFYDYLVDPNQGKFQKDHVKLLLNEDANKVNIMDMLGDSFLPHAANPDDLVVIYLSTHGSPAGADIRGVNYVVAYDTQLRRLFATGIEMRQLLRIIKERVHTNRILLVLDTCYSGAGGESHKGLVRTNVDSNNLAQGIGSLVICSSNPEQKSWESDELRNSYFTKFFIDALKEKPGQTSIDQAFNSMKQKVQQTVLKDKGEMQTPVMSGSFCGPQLVLSAPANATHQAPITITFNNSGAEQNQSDKAMSSDLSTYGEKIRLAYKLMEENKLWDATHALNIAIKANPESVEARLLASDLYDTQGRFNEEFESAKKAVLNDEESAQSREKLSRAYMRMNQIDEALRQAQKAVTLDPENSMGFYWMAYINEHFLKHADQAEQLYKKAIELNSLNGKAYLGLALLLQKQGKDAQEIEKLIRKAIEADEDDSEARLALGQILAKQNDLKNAEIEIHRGIEQAPNNPRLHAQLADIISHDKARAQEAELEYRKALELGPDVGYCHYVFAKFLLVNLTRIDEAEKEYRQAIKLDPDLDEARVQLGDLLVIHKKVYDQADEEYKKALITNPRNALALVGIARIQSELYKNYNEACTTLKNATILEPNLPIAYNMLGLIYQKNLGHWSEAKLAYEKALELNPNFAEAHYNLALLLLERVKENSPNIAFDHLKKACQANPKCSTYHTKLGWMQQFNFKKYKEAQAEYNKAIEINIADSEAHLRLGLILIEKFGERKAGERELRTAYEQNPENQEIKSAYERYAH